MPRKNVPPHPEALYFTRIELRRSLPHLLERTYTPRQARLLRLSSRDTPDPDFRMGRSAGPVFQKGQADRIPHAIHQHDVARIICEVQRVTGRLGPNYGRMFNIG